MLLICQSVLALFSGSQPFLSATVTPAGTPPLTPHAWSALTFSMSDRAYSRSALVSGPPGSTIRRSSAIWSAGVVVVRPQPGHGNPVHSTQADGVVCVAQPRHCTAPMPTAAAGLVPEAGGGVVVTVLDHLLGERLIAGRSGRPAAADSRVSRMSTLTMLASACAVPSPRRTTPGQWRGHKRLPGRCRSRQARYACTADPSGLACEWPVALALGGGVAAREAAGTVAGTDAVRVAGVVAGTLAGGRPDGCAATGLPAATPAPAALPPEGPRNARYKMPRAATSATTAPTVPTTVSAGPRTRCRLLPSAIPRHMYRFPYAPCPDLDKHE